MSSELLLQPASLCRCSDCTSMLSLFTLLSMLSLLTLLSMLSLLTLHLHALPALWLSALPDEAHGVLYSQCPSMLRNCSLSQKHKFKASSNSKSLAAQTESFPSVPCWLCCSYFAASRSVHLSSLLLTRSCVLEDTDCS